MFVENWLGPENQLGIDIWNKKYRHKEETFDEWLDRVSGRDEELRELIVAKKLLLGGRTLANRGIDNTGSYFNCYSYGFLEDDYAKLLQGCSDVGLTFKSQGGQGVSFSKLRPKGTKIKEEYYSDGIVPFMKIYNEVTAGTSQGGSRKGALMMSIDARHKEAETFIRIKSQEGEIEKANLSLEIDNEFMTAVKKYYVTGEVITLHEKRNYSGHEVEYDVVPIEIFKALVDNCYDWADPAALFVDRFRNFNLMEFDDEYNIETCNPCGEQPLPKHGACCLSSVNLSEFVINPYQDDAYFDIEGFKKAVRVGIRTLDKLIDENYYRHPLKEQQEMSYNYRNVGLGAFGYATALMKMGMKYGSEEAQKFTNDIFGDMFRAAVFASNELAKEFGTFPKYKDCVLDSDIIKKHFFSEEIAELKEHGLRNCSLISIAPTGSLATMLGESGGCEPEFALKFTRRTVGMTDGEDHYYDVYCKAAQEYMKLHNTNELPDYFVGANDIPWKDRVITQAIMQQHVDTAISSTVNLPNTATKEDIAQLYLLAWELGCKGITIFRDGCKKVGILTTNNKKEEPPKNVTPSGLGRGDIICVSDDLLSMKRTVVNGCGKFYIHVDFDECTGEPLETFIEVGSGGGCERNLQFISRLISLALRSGVPLSAIIDQTTSIRPCKAYTDRTKAKGDTSKGTSCPSAIGYALKELQEKINARCFVDDEDEMLEEIKSCSGNCESCSSCVTTKEEHHESPRCPECGEKVRFESGCVVCPNCGYSKC